MTDLFKGVLIGLVFGLPVGAVGALTVRRTLLYGIKSGLLTGLGSSAADCFYACVGAFGFTMVSDFLLRYRIIITVFGGGLILWMGVRLLLRQEDSVGQKEEESSFGKMVLSSFGIGITNPAAILTFLFAFSYFDIQADAGVLNGLLLVGGVFLGTYFWWTALTATAYTLKTRSKQFNHRRMNQVFGIILCLFGAVVFLRLFL